MLPFDELALATTILPEQGTPRCLKRWQSAAISSCLTASNHACRESGIVEG